ncbi:MAG: hypothetical protein ACRDSH_24615 [Pseudonocardiaceae bacterium]
MRGPLTIPGGSVDLDAVADELYSLPPDEFTAARNAAAARAREQSGRELAEQIGALRRPSTAAWLANMLARERPEQVRALTELGEQLRATQHQLRGGELRRLSQQRHDLVNTIVGQVRTAGHPVSDAVSRDLVNTFTAAVNSRTAARALAGGRLTTALDPADATTELFAEAEAETGTGHWSRPEPGGEPGEPAQRDLERVRAQAADAESAREQAQRALSHADQAARKAATALQELRARVEAAEQAEHEARHRAGAAQRDLEAADLAAREAQQRMQELEDGISRQQSR